MLMIVSFPRTTFNIITQLLLLFTHTLGTCGVTPRVYGSCEVYLIVLISESAVVVLTYFHTVLMSHWSHIRSDVYVSSNGGSEVNGR